MAATTVSLRENPLLVRLPANRRTGSAIDWHQAHRNVRRLQVAYRQGDSRREMGEGQSAPASPDSLVQRQSLGRATSDGKPRQTDTRCGRNHLGHTRTESNGHHAPAAAELSAPTPQACVYSQCDTKSSR